MCTVKLHLEGHVCNAQGWQVEQRKVKLYSKDECVCMCAQVRAGV